MSPEECTTTTQLIFPYRGVYVRHVGHDQAVAEANQVLFFNAHEAYRVSHPVAGGDGSLTLVIEESWLEELAPADFLYRRSRIAFRRQRSRIDARAQALVALLRHSLRRSHVLGRLRREIKISGDPRLIELLQKLQTYLVPSRTGNYLTSKTEECHRIVVPFQLATKRGILSFFTTTTIFCTPIDITLSELSIELFYPTDDATAEALREASADPTSVFF
jgi:hypothetical protein